MWSHKAELHFVQRLGSWSTLGPAIGRRALLERYLAALDRRADLQGIARQAMRHYVLGLLHDLRHVRW